MVMIMMKLSSVCGESEKGKIEWKTDVVDIDESESATQAHWAKWKIVGMMHIRPPSNQTDHFFFK